MLEDIRLIIFFGNNKKAGINSGFFSYVLNSYSLNFAFKNSLFNLAI